jgi:hypothetical protein
MPSGYALKYLFNATTADGLTWEQTPEDFSRRHPVVYLYRGVEDNPAHVLQLGEVPEIAAQIRDGSDLLIYQGDCYLWRSYSAFYDLADYNLRGEVREFSLYLREQPEQAVRLVLHPTSDGLQAGDLQYPGRVLPTLPRMLSNLTPKLPMRVEYFRDIVRTDGIVVSVRYRFGWSCEYLGQRYEHFEVLP